MKKMMPMHQNFKNFIKISLIPWKFHNFFKKSCQKLKKSKKSDKISIFYKKNVKKWKKMKKNAKKWKKMQKIEKIYPITQKKWKSCQKLDFWTPKKYPKTEFSPQKTGFPSVQKVHTRFLAKNAFLSTFLQKFSKNRIFYKNWGPNHDLAPVTRFFYRKIPTWTEK
jgi:hypothetical protein